MTHTNRKKILFIDNYDSFTYNVVGLLKQLSNLQELESTMDLQVIQNDEYSVSQIKMMSFSHIILGPGPGHPQQAGVTLDLIHEFAPAGIPFLGICLGHQALAHYFGERVTKNQHVAHGKVDFLYHIGNKSKTFMNLPSPFQVVRYHSLIVKLPLVSNCLLPTAYCQGKDNLTDHLSDNLSDDLSGDLLNACPQELMAFEHKNLPCAGLQFHPESILSQFGVELLKNFFLFADRF